MAPSRLPPSYPPTHHHTTTPLASSTAQTLLAAYLKSAEKHPYLHPTSLLSSTGIAHGPNSGPTGGLAMHHLRRIEAGLRGESLTAETHEELVARFGDSEADSVDRMVSTALDKATSLSELHKDDEAYLDATFATSMTESGEPKKKRKKEDQEKGSKKRKNIEEIAAWAEESSKAGSPADGTEDMTEFQQTQQPVTGEVRERDAAPKSKQNGAPPPVLTHDKRGNLKPQKKGKTEQEKFERNAAKKKRNKAIKAAKLKDASG